jgi:hypothetical protein
MTEREDPFDVLLKEEIKRLTDVLPEALRGGAPISILLFQPTQVGEGRLAYIDGDISHENPILLLPRKVSDKALFDPDDKAPWTIANENIKPLNIAEFRERNAPDVRVRLAAQEQKRYKDVPFDENDGTVPVGTRNMVHHVFPVPSLLETMEWWKRLPRLGQIYSLGEKLEHQNLLLILATRAGNRALTTRLKTLLDHESVLKRTAHEIGAAAAKGEDNVDGDNYTCIIAHLLICHHWFYPYDPVALKIFARLKVDVNETLRIHGWPTTSLGTSSASESDSESDKELIELMVNDLVFLINACARRIEQSERSSQSIREGIRKNLPAALALVGGVPVYAVVKGSAVRGADVRGNEVTYHSRRPSEPTHMCIMPPADLQSLFDAASLPDLPLFHYGQVSDPDLSKKAKRTDAASSLRAAAESYVFSLCPLPHPTKREAWNEITVIKMRKSKTVEYGKFGKWVTGYARGRCVLKMLSDIGRPEAAG